MTPPSLTQSIRNWLAGNAKRPAIPDACAPFLRNHRVLGLLYHIDADLSESLRAEARSNWEKNAHAYLKRVSALKDVWPMNAPAPMLIKGTDYNENLYFDPGARVAYDLDCLVHPSAVHPAFTATHPWHRRVSLDKNDGLGVHWDALVEGVLLEFHSVPGPTPPWTLDMESIWTGAIPITLDGFSCFVPHPMDRLYIYLINQAKSAFTDGFWSIVDLALILRRIRADGIEWSDVEARVSERGLQRVYSLALYRLTKSRLISDVPSLPEPALSSYIRRLVPAGAPTHLGSTFRREALRVCLCPKERRLDYLKITVKRMFLRWGATR